MEKREKREERERRTLPWSAIAMRQMTCMKGMFSTIIWPTAMGKEEVRVRVIWQMTVDRRNICTKK